MLEHFLHRFVAFRIIPRQLQCSRARHTGYQFTPLESRSLIRVSGPDSLPFLQGLITNDIQKLKTQPSLYTLFLNQAGRVLFDSIIYKSSTLNTLLIEADSHVCQTLIRHLKLYRVRRKVEIDDASSELKPWVVWNPSHTDIPPSLRQIDTSSSPSKTTDSLGAEKSLNLNIEKIEGIRDPRLEALGWRVLLPPTQRDIESKSVHLERSCEVTYKTLLYGLGVGEGCVDFPIGSSFPLESNVDFLHGVSFEKGCYIGQELTARTYHTGVVRKRLMPFRYLLSSVKTYSLMS